MTNFGAKLEHLLASRAELIGRMHRPPAAEGNDLDKLLGPTHSAENIPRAPSPNVINWPDEVSAAFCAVTPPIETLMDVPDDIRREQFFSTARRDDILVGTVNVIQDSGLVVLIMAYDQGPRRDFDGLKLTGFCPLRQLPRYNPHGNALDSFQIGDKVRAFILDVHPTGRLILSMNSKILNRDDGQGDLKMGLISDDELPLHYKKLQNLDGKSYEAYLESTPQFRNPDGLRILCSRMGIPRSSACTLLTSMSKLRLPKSEMACELRRNQLLNFSMKHVAQGVKYFKDGRNTEAHQCYNFAIEVEPTNPDAYVARGALHASVGTYSKAIEDLDKSLDLQPNHVNAKNYLGQTLVAYAGEVSRKDPSKAEQLLLRALKLDVDNNEARDALKELQLSGPIKSSASRDASASMRSWSRSPTPEKSSRHVDQSPNSPGRSYRNHRPLPNSHLERSRQALQHMVNEDRSSRITGSPGRYHDRRRDYDHDMGRRDSSREGAGFTNQDRVGGGGGGDLSKIVITRNRSGRVIRCRDEEGTDYDRDRRDGSSKRGYPDDEYHNRGMNREGSKRGRGDYENGRGTRRFFTPPRNAHEHEDGSHTIHENENDLPMTSKSLQERVKAGVRAVEARHRFGGGPPMDEDLPNGYHPRGPSPRGGGHWRGGDRSRGSFNRHDHYPRGGYYQGGRGGGPMSRGRPPPRGGWRGDDFRGRRGGWGRYDDRRREGPPPSFDRRPRRRFPDRSSRSGSRSSSSASSSKRSRRSSRSGRGANNRTRTSSSSSGSRSPVRRLISSARIKTPPLAPLPTIPRPASDEHLADVHQFVAQLKAKRQLQSQMPAPGPQAMPPPTVASPPAALEPTTEQVPEPASPEAMVDDGATE